MRPNVKQLEQSQLYPHYYKLIGEKRPWWYWIAPPVIVSCNIVHNALAICLGRLLAIVIFNPLMTLHPEQDHQRHDNLSRRPDPEHLEDFVVINVTKKSNLFVRMLKNYARKIQSHLPDVPEWIKKLVQYVLNINVITEDECMRLVGKVVAAAQAARDGEAPLNPENIFIKGIEYIEPELRVTTLEVINQALANCFDLPGFNIDNNRKKMDFFSLETVDNAVLDSVAVHGSGQDDKSMEKQTFTIFCMPRSNSYTAWLKKLRIYAEHNHTTYIAFNYRGVERSQGIVWSQHDMVADAIAQARRLIKLGAKPENITFEGECLGGAIATLAAAKMHEQGERVRLFNCRSFRSTSRLLLGKILPGEYANPWSPLNWLRYIAAGAFVVVGIPLLKLSHWNLNAGDAWDKIPDLDAHGRKVKDFITVRSPQTAEGKTHADDKMVDHRFASIYSKVLERLWREGNATKQQRRALQPHCFMVNPERGGDPRTRDGHTCPLYQLQASGSMQPLYSAREYQSLFYTQAEKTVISPSRMEANGVLTI